ncbi:uncharacterized protein B0T15DRAFT_495508 [Chaetomium strumarium]|uniref:Uncharacterized protein n=1 Tax=Chaetomium strumarium TaxID=1170767 RepID=A0AAJ0GND0_9PEZI|nr:hypothetical protein B0T15DRAFT_495508 [Chaetomium strumarium]
MHLSEVGNFIGSSMGGALKPRHLCRDAYLDQGIRADTLQDPYLTTTPAWNTCMQHMTLSVKARSRFGEEGKAEEKQVGLDPGERAERDGAAGEFRFGRGGNSE